MHNFSVTIPVTEFHSFIFVFFNSLTLHKRECPIMICCFTLVSITDSRFRSFFTLISFKRFNFSLRIVMILTQTRFVHSINLDQYPPKINPACSFHATAKEMTLLFVFNSYHYNTHKLHKSI